VITNPRDGELAWAWKDEAKQRARVVHVPYACPRWKHTESGPPPRGTENLDYFLGRLGLLELLARIDSGDLPVAMGLELVRRLHVPGYEQYRLFRREYNASGAEYPLPAIPDALAYRDYLELKKDAALDGPDS
jgi:hypothetical protein